MLQHRGPLPVLEDYGRRFLARRRDVVRGDHQPSFDHKTSTSATTSVDSHERRQHLLPQSGQVRQGRLGGIGLGVAVLGLG